MNSSNSPDIKPEIVFIPDLLKEMNSGRLRIPKFQRPFVWTPEKMVHLLDSIRNRYPIGSVLIWDTDQKMKSSDIIGPNTIGPPPEGIIAYALDGQQRLSTLFGTLLLKPENKEVDWVWRIWFDLKSKTFVHLKNKEPGLEHFPVTALLDTYDFFEIIDGIRSSALPEVAKSYTKDAQELAETFKSYKVPVTRIQNTSMDEAVKIFARLNSSGLKVSDDQMVSALAYKENDGQVEFDLASEIDTISEELAQLEFDIQRAILLRVILAELELDVYRTNWEFMIKKHASKFPDAVKKSLETLKLTIKFLTSIGVKCGALLPYSMQLVVLSSFFRKCTNPNPHQTNLLERWFWVSSYTGWFASGSSSSIRNAMSDMDRIAGGATTFDSINLTTPANPFPSTYDFRSARVRVQVIFLLSLKPLETDKSEMKAWDLIARSGYKALKHIFRTTQVSKDLYRSPVNRTLFFIDRNEGLIGKLTDATVRESHCVDNVSFEALTNGDPSQFLALRKNHMRERELEFMQRKGVTSPISNHEENVLDTGEELAL